MKKSILISLVLFLSCCVPVLSQQKLEKFVGVWQLCNQVKQDNGAVVIAYSPIWKVLQPDGKFSQFVLAYKNGKCAITHRGTYEVNSDELYTEHITMHAVDKAIVGTKTLLNYHFINDNELELNFKLQGREDKFHEIWYRVMPYEMPQK